MIDDEDQGEKDDEIEEAQEHFTQLVRPRLFLCSTFCENRASEKFFRAVCRARLLSSKEDPRLAGKSTHAPC
jgi:hypothetical protein